jgi:tRNA threonylcarbamoyladenosine biosynthesis protein TsaB
MVRILSLETSTTVCSVAIHENETLLAGAEIHLEHSPASKLAQLVDDVSKLAGIELRKLSAVAVSSGPGSYTGLRIGTSTAKGICYALSVPLIAIDTLSLLTEQMNKVNVMKAWLCPMIDARRMEVYCSVSDFNGKLIHPIEAKIIDEKSFEELLDGNRIIFFGNGSEKCQSVITHSNAVFVSGITPSAAQMGVMAHKKYKSSDTEDLVGFEPLYLKEFKVKKPANLLDASNKIEGQ